MKKILLILLSLSSLAASVKAQPYGNEWIHYNQSYLKFYVWRDGVYRITESALQQAGINLSTYSGANFSLIHNGAEIPLYVTNSGNLSTSDYLEFYGYHNDGTLDSSLFDSASWQGNEQESIFTDTACYFLTWDNSTTHLRIQNFTNDLTNHSPKLTYCIKNVDTVYAAQQNINNFDAGENYLLAPLYQSDFNISEGYPGATFGQKNPHIANVSTPNSLITGPTPVLKYCVIGWVPQSVPFANHQLSVSIGGTPLAVITKPNFYVERQSFTLASNAVISPATTITFSTVTSPNTNDYNGVSWIKLSYSRDFNFNSESVFRFMLPASATNQYIEISHFTDALTPVLYDFTNNLRLQAIVNSDTLKFNLPPSNVNRDLFLLEPSIGNIFSTLTTIDTISSLIPVSFVDYSQSGNQGNFLIVTHPYFFSDSTGHNYIQDYADYKNSSGFHSVIFNILQLYDEFGYGIKYSPLCMRNLTHFIMSTWPTQQRYELVIGKGVEYALFNLNNGGAYKPLFFVPCFGDPGSDNLLTSLRGTHYPAIPIGRLPITNTNDLNSYLTKLKDYISQQQIVIPLQNIANKLWTKEVLQLAGGNTLSDQTTFQQFIGTLSPVVRDTFYGAHIDSFFKLTADPVSQAVSEKLDSLFTTGIPLITYFGHSSLNLLDFNLNTPEDYNNYQKYPFFMVAGCEVGYFYLPQVSLSEQWTFAPNRGSIGFLASSSYTPEINVYYYLQTLYNNFSIKNYNKSVGIWLQSSMQAFAQDSANPVNIIVAEQNNLDGDPSVSLNQHAQPDYDIEPQNVIYSPRIITAALDSFKVSLVIANLGKAIRDSILVDVKRIFPDNTQQQLFYKKIYAPYYVDTVSFFVQTLSPQAVGANSLNIKINENNWGEEITNMNNSLNSTFVVTTKDILPVFPYDFSIVNTPTVILKASTVNAFEPSAGYMFEIDTTTNFNSPQFHKINITQAGGVVQWPPPLTLKDSVVYYWRCSVDSVPGMGYNWHTSSFIYLAGSSPGWNQSHYFQYLENSFGNEEMSSSRQFSYVPNLKSISVLNGIMNYPPFNGTVDPFDDAFYVDGYVGEHWASPATMIFAVLDSATGLLWQSPYLGTSTGEFGDYHPYTRAQNAFYFLTDPINDPASYAAMKKFIDTIPKGDYVLAMSQNYAYFGEWDSLTKQAFHSIGAILIDTLKSNLPYVLFGRKNEPGYPAKEIIVPQSKVIDTSFTIVGKWDNGFVESPLIGPAASWTSLHWKNHALGVNTDSVGLQLYGVDSAGVETLLSKKIIAADTSLAGISTKQYPYLRLLLYTQDTIARTPTQLNFWRVNYSPIPDAALDPEAYSNISDSLYQGQPFHFDIAIRNVTPYPMDSLEVKYIETDAKNVQHTNYKTYRPLKSLDTLHTNYSYSLVQGGTYFGLNSFYVEANPYDKKYQPEQFHYNNIGTLNFSNAADKINPLLDVTFDGIHILNNDIVSAKPDIFITLSDNDKYLPLNDTSVFQIQLIYPDGSKHTVHFDNVSAIFTPATSTSKENSATAELKYDFPIDGKYQLVVQGYDEAHNPAGNYSYQIDFEVINKPMISEVLNYPNPFTSKTHFVFMLTGSEVPQFIKIQILTITGKVIKEIEQNELGPLHIGRNITNYYWDGTDQFGDPVGNGVYLYRVVAKLNGTDLSEYETGVDKYFKNGWGKMYLMR
jgi:hypothetical protein